MRHTVRTQFNATGIQHFLNLRIAEFVLLLQFAFIVMRLALCRPVTPEAIHDQVERGLAAILFQQWQGLQQVVGITIVKGDGIRFFREFSRLRNQLTDSKTVPALL